MRLPFTPYGLREILLYGGVSAAAVAGLLVLGSPWHFLVPVPALVLVFVLSFFRDPARRVPAEAGAVVSPADGRVVAITDVPQEEFIGGPATRIDIFLAVYNVHVNRAPLAGEVRYIEDRQGVLINAMKLEAGERNHARCVGLVTDDGGFPVLVRQIVGAIARRIVTAVRPGDRLAKGQRFGMLKFGSRTQLSIPKSVPFAVWVKVGDRVRGGATVLGTVRPGEPV
ncbi:MAG: phosphatidylserine decarboxylase [Planctomycetes bacterium]|nr:phosphatidylserine decarboxylase [Planctomycetota bacterium]